MTKRKIPGFVVIGVVRAHPANHGISWLEGGGRRELTPHHCPFKPGWVGGRTASKARDEGTRKMVAGDHDKRGVRWWRSCGNPAPPACLGISWPNRGREAGADAPVPPPQAGWGEVEAHCRWPRGEGALKIVASSHIC